MDSPFPIESHRKAEHPVDPLFLKRWSPRSMTGEKIELPVLMTLFEAARWAPSSGNLQPWRFIYGLRETPAFDRLYENLGRGNKSWCDKASALVLVVSKIRHDDGKPMRTHSYDTGSAWVSLALQASLLNLVAHGMAGFDYDKAREIVSLPDDYQPEAMIAIGYPGPIENLPEDKREKEKPSSRKSINEFVFEGIWKA